jgi:hypothetical protein
MTKGVNFGIKNLRYVFSVGLAAATLAVVLTYVLGAQAILKSPFAEPGHELFMSMYMPLMQEMQGLLGQTSQSQQMHGSPALQSQIQADPHAGSLASQSQMDTSPKNPNQFGIIGNNILGSPTGLSAGGLAAVVVYSIIPLAAAAFVVSRKQRSFAVAGLLAASGITLMILPLANMNFVFPGPIIGVVVGLGIFGLGVTKGLRTAYKLSEAE